MLSFTTLVGQECRPYRPGVLSLTAAAVLMMAASFVIYLLMTVWYAVPWLRVRPFERAVEPLLWIHATRYVALILFSAQQFGLVESDSAVRQIAFGDLVGAALAIVCLVAVRGRLPGARALIWVFVLATVADLGNALRVGLAEHALATAHDVFLVVLTFAVPLLWISTGLIVWLLVRRRGPQRAANVTG
jgi:hypothetical protein